MRRLFRWLRKNMRSTPTSVDQIEKVEQVYLHEKWFDHFKADLDSWARRR